MNEELLKSLIGGGDNYFFGGADLIPSVDDDYTYSLEGAQSVPDLCETPFLNQLNYPKIEAAPQWMSENFQNGDFKLNGESGRDEQINNCQGEIPGAEYSPAPSTTSSFFAHSPYSESEERVEPRNEAYTKLISSLGITEERLQKFSVKELNRFLKSNGLTKQQQQLVKNRRRTLKNRGYAQNCRIRRIKLKKSLEVQNEDLLQELDQLRAELEKAKKERNYYKSKLVQVAKYFKDQKGKAT